MANINMLIDPARLIGITRKAMADEEWLVNQFQLRQWFPYEETWEIDYDYTIGTDRTYSESAQFRQWDVRPRPGKRPGSAVMRGDIPPISIEYLIREYDKIKMRSNNRDGNLEDDMLPTVAADVVRAVAALERRYEIVRRDLLVNAQANIREGGLNLDMLTGRDANRASTVLAGWDDPVNARPMTDERNVMRTMLRGENIQHTQYVAMMNSLTWQGWLDTEQVRNYNPTIRPLDTVTEEAGAALRRSHNLPSVIVNDSQMENPLSGVVEFIIPDWKVLYLPTFRIGATLMSVPSMADDPDIDLEYSQRPGPIAYMVKELVPYNNSTVMDAVGTPLLQDPDATYCLTAKP